VEPWKNAATSPTLGALTQRGLEMDKMEEKRPTEFEDIDVIEPMESADPE